MKRPSIRLISLLLAACILLSLAACGEAQPDPDEPYTLRVVTNVDAINPRDHNVLFAEVERLAAAWEADHEGMSIELEKLPVEPEARETRLSQLRTEILAGSGPDVFLLSDRHLYYEAVYSVQETLFSDVAQAMHNGMFYDISALYDADEELNQAGLCAAVMDAGTVDGGRYVLPLRYTFPVVYADKATLDASGLDVEKMMGSVTGLWDELIASGDPRWTSDANSVFYWDDLFPFSRLADYASGQAALSEEDAAAYIRQYRQIHEQCSGYTTNVWNAVHYVFFDNLTLNGPISQDGVWLTLGELGAAVDAAAVAKATGIETVMFPLRGVDGSLNAYVPFWGAVSANCQRPELAYDFLRQFLQEEHQWDTPRDPNDGTVLLPGNGWPVRYTGAAEHLWVSLRDRFEDSRDWDANKRIGRLRRVDVSDDDVLPLLIEPDHVHLPTTAGAGFNKLALDEAFSPEDAARQFIDSLQWHLDEG